MTTEEILFINHYQELSEEIKIKSMERLLGTTWNLEDLQKMSMENEAETGEVSSRKELFIPLTAALNPTFYEKICELAGVGKGKSNSGVIGEGEYVAKDNEKIDSVGTLSKDEFKKMLGMGG